MGSTPAPKTGPEIERTLKFVHDARSPLNAIQGAFELLQLSDMSDRNQRLAKAGHDAAKLLETLLDTHLANEFGEDAKTNTPS